LSHRVKMRSSFGVVVFLLAALLGTSHAQKCTAVCPRSLPTAVVPKVESTYVYSLEAKTTLTPRDTQKVTIKADAEVAIQNVCEAVLRLKNVAIEGVANGAELAAQVGTNPIGFGYFNGKVRGVCPTKDEEEWVTNIKKAVISALQLSATGEESSTEINEEDFSGKCPTTYTKQASSDKGTVIQKKKDLNKCSERRIDLRLSPDQALSQFKELVRHYLHPVDSQLSCKVTLKDLVVKDVECEETHTLVHRHDKPIHVSNLKLNLKDTKTGIAADFAEREVVKQEIFLTHEHKHDHAASEADVVAVLKELCQQVSDKTAHIESSNTFAKLVDLLKYLPSDAASSVDEAVKSGSICAPATKRLRELFLDASAFAASDSGIKTLVKAHNNQELSVSRAAAAFTVVALKAAPNEETVRALLPLIDSDTTTRPLLLGFSVLIRRYCEKTKDCETNAAIQEARDVYVNRIGKTTDKLIKVTLIKGLENLNVNKNGNENVVKLLDEIINSQEAGDGARLAAVKALPNEPSINDQLKSIVLKEANPNEVRIAAFQKLATNSGLKDVNQLLGVQEHCVKNYILTYLKNLKNAKNPVRRALVPDNVEIKEEPSTKFGITKNLAYEYGPLFVDVDVVYPKDSNVTRSITARISKIANDKIVEVAEISVRQEGLDRQVGNVLNLVARKINPTQFGFEVVKDLSELAAKLKKKDHEHNHLQVSGKVNGKNIIFTDAFEDLHTLVDLLRKRVEKVISEKKVDRTLGSVLIDTKVIVPTVTGIPVIYKLNDNVVIQINGEVDSNGNKKHFILNRSLVAGISASIKLKLKDQKLGYEYNAKVAFTPNIDVEVEKKDKTVSLQINLKEEKQTLLKLKQSLKEIKVSGTKVESENELAPEPRSDDCVSALILNYCRKASQVKGLKIPNVEYYLTKPDAAITAIKIELQAESPDATSKKFLAKVTAVGSSNNREHLAQLEVAYPKDATKEVKLLLKSPENSFETKFALNLDQSRNLNVKLNLPHFIDVTVQGKFEKEKETNALKNDLLIEYKFPDDATTHTLKFKNSLAYNLKRSGKDKVANLDYSSLFESSRRPFLNHRSLVQFKYRPYKVNELVLEFAYGKDLSNLYKFSRIAKVDVQEFRPFKMNSESETKIVATDFDIDYELKADTRVLSDKGNALEFDLNLKGKDLSKRAASGDNSIDGKVEYRNKGSSVDSKLDASLKLRGREMGWNSELKQVEPQKYEGKITIQTDKDKKIFIVHKEEISKPTKEINLKSEADISYSYKPDKKTYKFEAKKQGSAYVMKGEAKKDGKVIMSNDVNFESSNGKLKALLSRDTRSYDLTVDNVFKPKEATLVFKIEDREYNIKMNREPLKYLNLKVNGNDKALIKNGEAHLSLIDPTKVTLVTKANSKIEVNLDLIASVNKKAALKIDSPKFGLVHEGDIDLSLVNRRILWKSYTKKDNREYKFDADIARKGSLISLQKITPERTSSVKYSRNGDKIEINLDTEFVEGKVEGDRKTGKIQLKNKDKNYELESTYKFENGKLVIESVSSNNAKLEAVISRKEPSKLVLETPNTKANLDLDLTTPVKTLKFNFDNPKYQKKIDAEVEHMKKFKYSSYGKIKADNKEQKIEVNGVPLKELNVDVDFPDFKFKVKQPESSKKVEFSYTFNNYTENEEYEFDPHKAYLVNWINALRQYAQTFIVQN